MKSDMAGYERVGPAGPLDALEGHEVIHVRSFNCVGIVCTCGAELERFTELEADDPEGDSGERKARAVVRHAEDLREEKP